ncbi:MAG: hypothetical protein KJ620_05095 [Candidatus Edwardsbacteria bacterium]|nr:hypothetical protein [Candidatus Edwardsbacteria bacterium]MBU1577114.1 hypothetical protein [Candidatus Edwardsbacteria bacterium]MBU2464622.1 hypothetical protein [Candidatus Edwardsbacteria bacterium]MBU2594046.1 hypothetical protein [Candidatus Edwardsbacteria bacterium]
MGNNIQKYEELYKLTKDSLDDELGRFKRLEEKASRYFSVMSIILVVAAFIGKMSYETIVPSKTVIDLFCFLLLSAFIFFILVAIIYLFSVFRIQSTAKPPMGVELIQFINNNRYIDIIYSLSKRNIEAIKHNTALSNRKTRYLSVGYRFIMIAFYTFISLMIFTTIRFWNVPDKAKSNIVICFIEPIKQKTEGVKPCCTIVKNAQKGKTQKK